MNEAQPDSRDSHLFLLRLWQEETDEERYEWRGQLRTVPGGERRYFRTWASLLRHLTAMLPESGARGPPEARDGR